MQSTIQTGVIMEYPKIKISKYKEKDKWVIRIKGITSGFIVHTESDNSTLEFKFDASRFDPIIKPIYKQE